MDDGKIPLNSVFTLDTRTWTWEWPLIRNVTDSFAPRVFHTATCLGDHRILLYGGKRTMFVLHSFRDGISVFSAGRIGSNTPEFSLCAGEDGSQKVVRQVCVIDTSMPLVSPYSKYPCFFLFC
jgi:hypothetical protein